MGQSLTTAERVANACYCPPGGRFYAGWTVDPVTREAVCSSCRKPSPMTVFRDCTECENEFILPRSDPRWEPLYGSLTSGKLVKNEFICTPCKFGDD